MGKKIVFHRKGFSSFFIYPAIALWLLSGCATPPAMNESASEEDRVPIIEQVRVESSPPETVVEVVNSVPTPYTAFQLSDPPRVVLDIRGRMGEELSLNKGVHSGNIADIRFQEGKSQAMTARMVVNLTKMVDYSIAAADNKIRLIFTSETGKKEPGPGTKTGEALTAAEAGPAKEEVTPSDPRILLKPRTSGLNQVLGIDFTMLKRGKSRLTVTTDKRVPYDLDRKGEKFLELTIHDTIAPTSPLMKEIKTTHFKSALDKVKPSFTAEKNELSLVLSLREMVPFHVKQTDTGLSIDFGRTTVKPADKEIKPIDLSEAQVRDLAAEQPAGPESQVTEKSTLGSTAGGRQKEYNGEPMYLDFVNADVTHILRLINEISKDNIIWDPAISGRKVSMILKNVPWDQALDLILDNNNLAKMYRGENIIWITTREKMQLIIAEEESRLQKILQKREEERKKLEEAEKKAKEEEPLIKEFIPVDFAEAGEIQNHITLTQRGQMSVDARTNTIIITDTAESIEDAKKTVRQFDTPVKQIMIEARIVDATNNFARDLGLRWNSLTSGWRKNVQSTVTVPPNANEFTTAGQRVWGGTFTSNSPANWAGNIGLSFARLTSSGLGALTLDASLALAENEGKAKVMSAPKVIAREGTAATISSGDSIIIPATENVASTTLDATLSLTVTPSSVSYNDFITLDVSVTDDQAPSTERLLRKSISTTLMVKSGETVVIGGIIKESESTNEAGIPVLRDIPGLGWMFKANQNTYNKSELLIFLTPTVLPPVVKNL